VVYVFVEWLVADKLPRVSEGIQPCGLQVGHTSVYGIVNSTNRTRPSVGMLQRDFCRRLEEVRGGVVGEDTHEAVLKLGVGPDPVGFEKYRVGPEGEPCAVSLEPLNGASVYGLRPVDRIGSP